jgi:hypothetical protein
VSRPQTSPARSASHYDEPGPRAHRDERHEGREASAHFRPIEESERERERPSYRSERASSPSENRPPASPYYDPNLRLPTPDTYPMGMPHPHPHARPASPYADPYYAAGVPSPYPAMPMSPTFVPAPSPYGGPVYMPATPAPGRWVYSPEPHYHPYAMSPPPMIDPYSYAPTYAAPAWDYYRRPASPYGPPPPRE